MAVGQMKIKIPIGILKEAQSSQVKRKLSQVRRKAKSSKMTRERRKRRKKKRKKKRRNNEEEEEEEHEEEEEEEEEEEGIYISICFETKDCKPTIFFFRHTL
uniref:Uncharacterized protein n=1 Tax=Strongyloides stercoralis TaxID=6248 RepID=A0AAF5CZ63_STRER